MWAEQEGLDRRRRTFPASELQRPRPRARAPPAPSAAALAAAEGAAPGRVRVSTGDLRHQLSEVLRNARAPGPDDQEAEMRLYRKELRADTPTIMKISALELMSKEFSATTRVPVDDGPLPRVADDGSHGPEQQPPWDDRGARRTRAARSSASSAAAGTAAGAGELSRLEEALLLAPSHPDSFRSAVRLGCLLGQIFSVLPTSTRPDIVPRFHYLSLRTLYWAVVTFLLLFNSILTVIYEYKVRREQNAIIASSSYMFYVSAFTVSVLYFRLARKWRALCLCFLRAEHRMRALGHPPSLRLRLRAITVAVLGLALVEYALAVNSGIMAMDWDKPLSEFLTDYYVGNYPQMSEIVPYNPFILLVSQMVNVIGTFMWNYNDAFVMIVSIAIAERFKLLNTKLHERPKKDKTPEFWREAREIYNALSLLTREVDHILTIQILFSFMNDLYFICIQLLHTVKHEDNTLLQNIYFVFSFGLLLIRTASVSLCAAAINDESKQVRKYLYSVSSHSYCEEVDRFIIQATTDEIALTGLKFFSVTRSFLLTVAGTIATYEIVLVQFNGNQKTT